MLAYKGLNADFTCRGFHFDVGETYTVAGEIVACKNGFHACENPFAVWSYYPVVADDGSLARYAEVVLSGATAKDGDKIAAAQITIKAELRLPEFMKRAVAAVIAATKGKGDNPSGNCAQIGSSGYDAQIGSSGYGARIGSSGNYARINAEGANAVIACAGSARVKAGPGGAICIPYHDGKRTRFAVGYVGEDGIEAGKWYSAEGGKLAEVA